MGGNNSKERGKKKIKRALTSSDNASQYQAKVQSNEKLKKFIKNKKNSKLTLYIIGENAESITYELLFSFLKKKNNFESQNKNNINYKKLDLKELKWTIYIIDENISDNNCHFIIDEIKLHFKNDHFCYDALIPIIDDINDTQCQTIIKNFENIDKVKKKQPFILFLTKKNDNPNRLFFQNLVNEKAFDIRNIDVSSIAISQKEEENNNLFKNIISKIWKIYSYYNGMGDLILIPSGFLIEKKHIFPYQLNILTCGKPGLGKSSFINIVLKEKRAKEGEGTAVTSDIIRYSHPFFPIAFYDTPGTDTPEAVQMLKEELELYNIKLKEIKKKIHLIIWFLDYRNRVDIKNEKSLLENLLKFDAEFLFVINYVNNTIESEEYKTKIEIIVDSLEEIFEGKVPDLKDRIIPVNLLNYTNEGIIITPRFGLDKLFNKIYSIFRNYIETLLSTKIQDKIKFMEEIYKNKLFSELIKAQDLQIHLKFVASKFVIDVSRTVFFSILRASKREKMIKELISMYFGNKSSNHIIIFEDFMKDIFEIMVESQIKEKGEKYYSNLFFEELKKMNNIYEFNIDYDIYCYNTYTIAVGYLVINYLENLLTKKDNFEESLRNVATSYIAAIEAIKVIGDEFKQYYNQ